MAVCATYRTLGRYSGGSLCLQEVPIWRGKQAFLVQNVDETRNTRLAGGAGGIRTYGTLLRNLPLNSRQNCGSQRDQIRNRD